jgi:hypothetical protein
MKKFSLIFCLFSFFKLFTQNPICLNQATLSTLNFWSFGCDTGDFNNDNITDFISKKGYTIDLILSNTFGNYLPGVSYTLPMIGYNLKSNDFNNDNNADMIVLPASDSNRVFIFFGNGAGTFTSTTTYSVNGTSNFVVADFNNDGNQDLITINNPFNVFSVHLGNGTGGFIQGLTYTLANTSHVVSTANFNNDANMDLVFGYGAIAAIYKGNGNGTFSLTTNLNLPVSASNILHCADVNNDGRSDIISYNTGGTLIAVAKVSSNFTFQPVQTYSVANWVNSITHTDINSDGLVDLVTGGYLSTCVLSNSGLGLFSTQTNYTVSNGIAAIYGVFPVKLNNDNKMDLVYAVDNDFMMRVLLNCNTVEVSEISEEESLIEVYPNPATDIVHLVRKELNSDLSVHIYDTNGQLRFTKEIEPSDETNSIQLSGMENGIYTMVLVDGNLNRSTKKFIISR